jgi:hypothetical protein
MGLHELAGNGQAQARSARILRFGEALEDVGQHLRRDPRAGIGDRDRDCVGPGLADDRHDAPVRRISQGIGHEIADDLLDAERVQVDERQVVGHPDRDSHSCRRGEALEGRGRLVCQDRQVGRFLLERQRAGFGQGECSEVLDELGHHGDLVDGGGQVSFVD